MSSWEVISSAVKLFEKIWMQIQIWNASSAAVDLFLHTLKFMHMSLFSVTWICDIRFPSFTIPVLYQVKLSSPLVDGLPNCPFDVFF